MSGTQGFRTAGTAGRSSRLGETPLSRFSEAGKETDDHARPEPAGAEDGARRRSDLANALPGGARADRAQRRPRRARARRHPHPRRPARRAPPPSHRRALRRRGRPRRGRHHLPPGRRARPLGHRPAARAADRPQHDPRLSARRDAPSSSSTTSSSPGARSARPSTPCSNTAVPPASSSPCSSTGGIVSCRSGPTTSARTCRPPSRRRVHVQLLEVDGADRVLLVPEGGELDG